MARTAITVQDVAVAGLNPSYDTAIADGHMFANDGNTIIHVKNDNASSLTLTIQTNTIVGGVSLQDHTVTIPASTERFIGLFKTGTFNQSDGTVYLDYSVQTSVTVAALKIPKNLS